MLKAVDRKDDAVRSALGGLQHGGALLAAAIEQRIALDRAAVLRIGLVGVMDKAAMIVDAGAGKGHQAAPVLIAAIDRDGERVKKVIQRIDHGGIDLRAVAARRKMHDMADEIDHE